MIWLLFHISLPEFIYCSVLAMSLGNCSIWLSGAHYGLLCFILFYSYVLCIVIFSSSLFIVVLSNVVSFLFICSTIISYLMVLGVNPINTYIAIRGINDGSFLACCTFVVKFWDSSSFEVFITAWRLWFLLGGYFLVNLSDYFLFIFLKFSLC